MRRREEGERERPEGEWREEGGEGKGETEEESLRRRMEEGKEKKRK